MSQSKCPSVARSLLANKQVQVQHGIMRRNNVQLGSTFDIDIFSGDRIFINHHLHSYLWLCPSYTTGSTWSCPKKKWNSLLNLADQGKAHAVYCQCSRGSSAGQMYHMPGRVQIPCLITQTSCWNLRLQDTSTKFGLRGRGARGEKYLVSGINFAAE